jgi:oxygen-independent coproporphyrinogen-3 oxidase
MTGRATLDAGNQEAVAEIPTNSATASASGAAALYVHIPFCERKCHYCDFNSGAHPTVARERYVDALIREIHATPFAGRAARSVFLGGGTPSVLPAASIARILNALRARFAFPSETEITVECNPGTVASERMAGETTEEFLGALRAAGVSRLSFGVQSFDSGLLKRLGRIHSPEQAERSVRLAQAAGFESINVDLMFALPGQTMAHWDATLDHALALGVPHISAYSLIVEPDTPFAMWDAGGRLPRPSEEEEAEMYTRVIERLAAGGFERYEVSAFARPGFRSTHNLVYWRNEEYIGFGNGATSYVSGERFSREPDLDAYMTLAESDAETVSDREHQDRDGEMNETMMMGLRLADGVNRAEFARRFGQDPLDRYAAAVARFEAAGLLNVTPCAIALSPRGFFLANEVWEAFV